jgi:hypothetical protein
MTVLLAWMAVRITYSRRNRPCQQVGDACVGDACVPLQIRGDIEHETQTVTVALDQSAMSFYCAPGSGSWEPAGHRMSLSAELVADARPPRGSRLRCGE